MHVDDLCQAAFAAADFLALAIVSSVDQHAISR